MAVLAIAFLKPSVVNGTSLKSAGYSLSSLENVTFENPYSKYTDEPLTIMFLEGDKKRKYASKLEESYTVIYAPMPWHLGSEVVPLMWLQVVKISDIQGLNPVLKTQNGQVSLYKLAPYQVYRDEAIVVYDVSFIERDGGIKATVEQYSEELCSRCNKSLNELQDMPERRDYDLINSVLSGEYRFEVISDMYEYLQGNLQQHIIKYL